MELQETSAVGKIHKSAGFQALWPLRSSWVPGYLCGGGLQDHRPVGATGAYTGAREGNWSPTGLLMAPVSFVLARGCIFHEEMLFGAALQLRKRFLMLREIWQPKRSTERRSFPAFEVNKQQKMERARSPCFQ